MNLTTHLPQCVFVCASLRKVCVCVSGERKRQTGEVRWRERERDMSQHPQDVSSFWAAVVWELEAALRRPVNSPLPHKPPCMQSRLRLPALLGHAYSAPYFFVSVYNRHLLIYSGPLRSPKPSLYSNQFPAIRRSALGNGLQHTHTHRRSKWANFMRKSISRAETDKEKKMYCFFQTRLIL